MKKLITVLAITLLLTGCADYNDDGDNGNGNGDTPNVSPAVLSTIDIAAHGDKSFNVTSVVVSDGVILDAKVDEYQFWSYASYPDGDIACVPNGETGIGDYYDGSTYCLGSKRANSDLYSAKMAEIAGAENTWLGSMTAIEDYAIGKTIEELKAFDKESDTIAGSTLVDTYNYLQSIIAAAEAAGNE